MMRWVMAVLAACALTACSSAANKHATATTTTAAVVPVAQLEHKASSLTDALIAGKYGDVVATFDDTMRSGLTASGLRSAWEQVVATYGAYKSRGVTAISTRPVTPGLTVFDTPMTFGTSAMKSRFTFDADGKVAGLYILNAGEA